MGYIDGEGWSIEVNIGVADPCDGFALHVRGQGDALLDTIAAILATTGTQALDSLEAWRSYRDQVLR